MFSVRAADLSRCSFDGEQMRPNMTAEREQSHQLLVCSGSYPHLSDPSVCVKLK